MSTAARPKVKGPRVWLDMDQQELDDAYDQIDYAPNRDQVRGASPTARRRPRRSARRGASPTGRRRSKGSTSIARSPTRRSRSSFTAAPGATARSDFSVLAEPFMHAGAHFVVLDFINVDDAGGDLMPCRAGAPRDRLDLTTPRASAATHRLHFSHSSGAHLAGCAVTRLGEGRPAQGRAQGRDAVVRHVRPQTGAAVGPLEIRQVHRRDEDD